MHLINRTFCSPQFLAAFDAVNSGNKARRESWPQGQHLAMKADQIKVVREGAKFVPAWLGPSGAESNATDWAVMAD